MVTITHPDLIFLPFKNGEIVEQRTRENPDTQQDETEFKISLETNLTQNKAIFNITSVWLFSNGFISN